MTPWWVGLYEGEFIVGATKDDQPQYLAQPTPPPLSQLSNTTALLYFKYERVVAKKKTSGSKIYVRYY